MAIIFVGMNGYSQTVDRDSQWDFFKNVIPKQKSITISGNNWTMTIDDKYKVSFSGSYSYQGSTGTVSFTRSETRTDSNQANATFMGQGVIVWDNEKIKINLLINASGTYDHRGHRRYNANEQQIGGRVQMVDEDFDWGASRNTTINTTFELTPEYINGQFSGKLKLNEKQLTLNLSGRSAHTASINVGSSNWYTATVVPKTESEINASANDEFGEWSWNTDRTRLFLKSQASDNKFIILNNKGTLTWCMELVKDAKGSSESATDTGDKIVNLAMAFDGAPAQNFSFIVNTGATPGQDFIQLDYVVFNRLLGTLDKNPDTVLNQIKEKQMLILTYTVNNAQKTDMFILDGLATILDYLKR